MEIQWSSNHLFFPLDLTGSGLLLILLSQLLCSFEMFEV